jgi:hypothetical protein
MVVYLKIIFANSQISVTRHDCYSGLELGSLYVAANFSDQKCNWNQQK